MQQQQQRKLAAIQQGVLMSFLYEMLSKAGALLWTAAQYILTATFAPTARSSACSEPATALGARTAAHLGYSARTRDGANLRLQQRLEVPLICGHRFLIGVQNAAL
jgi:hypothetical protein